MPQDLWSKWSSMEKVITRLLLIFGFIVIYIDHTDCHARSVALIAALTFMVIETVWTSFVNVGKFEPRWIGHTTLAQFYANLLYTPILILGYRSMITDPYLRVLLFPLNIWLLEAVQGYTITYLFGRNLAWTYEGEFDSLLHGNIKLTYAFPWWLLGITVELIFDPIIMPLAAYIEPYYEVSLLLACIFTMSTYRLLRWPLIGIPKPN